MNGDGVALHSTRHPILVTDEMIEAGRAVLMQSNGVHVGPKSLLRDVYEAMTYAAPYQDYEISEDALVTREIEVKHPALDEAYQRIARLSHALARIECECSGEYAAQLAKEALYGKRV